MLTHFGGLISWSSKHTRQRKVVELTTMLQKLLSSTPSDCYVTVENAHYQKFGNSERTRSA